MWGFLANILKEALIVGIGFSLIISLFLLVAGISNIIREPTNVVEGLSTITHAAELHGRTGELVIISAEIEYTGIYRNYSPTNRTRRLHDINQHLYIIRFEDAPVAFTSNHNDRHLFDDIIIGRISKMPNDFVAERLLNWYLPDSSEFFQYTLRCSNQFTIATFEEHNEFVASSVSWVFWSAIVAIGSTLLLILTIRLLDL